MIIFNFYVVGWSCSALGYVWCYRLFLRPCNAIIEAEFMHKMSNDGIVCLIKSKLFAYEMRCIVWKSIHKEWRRLTIH